MEGTEPQKKVVRKAFQTTTKKYTFQTVGQLDTVMVVSEIAETENHYMSGDDNNGFDKNSKITLSLVKGRDYLSFMG